MVPQERRQRPGALTRQGGAERMAKILVTGAAGQIGSELVAALRAAHGKDHVVATDLRMPVQSSASDGIFEHLDCTKLDQIQDAVRRHSITIIYHLAAMLSAV